MEAAIIAAFGEMMGVYGDIVVSFNNRRNIKDSLDFERESRYYQVIDYQQQTLEKDNTNLIIIGILSLIAVVLIVVVALKNKK